MFDIDLGGNILNFTTKAKALKAEIFKKAEISGTLSSYQEKKLLHANQ